MKSLVRFMAVALVAGVLFLGSASAARAQCAVAAPAYYYPPPAVSYYAPAYTPSYPTYYTPSVSYYYTPKVSYYAAPAVSYYGAPVASYYPAAPVGGAVTTTNYGLFGRPKSTTTYYYPQAVLVP